MARKSTWKRLTGQEITEAKQRTLAEQEDEFDEEGELWIEIEGERMGAAIQATFREWAIIDTDGGEYLVVESYEVAEQLVKDRWREMDTDELLEMIGAEQIIQSWLRNQSFEDWLDDYIRNDGPAGELAGYDGEQGEVGGTSEDLIEDLGFTPSVAYRTN